MPAPGATPAHPAAVRSVRVFVSSTWLDLGPERQAVEEVLQRFRETKFVGMEYFGSAGADTRTTSLDAVERCQCYIGIVGDRYGSGITEAEYERARALALPCLIYLRAAPARCAGERDALNLDRFRATLRASHIVSEFRNPDELAARVAADLHNWLFDSWLTESFVKESAEGIAGLPADYASRIQNFLVEYLGSARRPVPFGGRAHDVTRLEEWLDAPEPPYAMLAAPAGRGKSALVARWTSSLLARPGTTVIFMPVSVRFRTNLGSVVFASLAARLARAFGEELPAMPEATVEVWRALVSSYLRREAPGSGRIIVVLDGLDEAADWEAGADLFPADPPRGLKVLVTARFRAGDGDGWAWMEALGWGDRLACALDLPVLTSEGVSDVLVRMGAPLDQVAANVDITEELFRLSEGDPLLVRLYTDDLWSRGNRAASLRPADLRAIRPGLEGYFQRWWREQRTLWGSDSPLRREAVQTLLNLLACALGPVTIGDLVEAAPRDTGLSTWVVEDSLQPLARFIVGDGRTHGLVFSHPRLAMYFRDQLSGAERRAWEVCFIEWGQRVVADLQLGKTAPAECSRYLTQYFGAHLERAGADPDRLFALVDDPWRLAWLAYEGSYGGFLNDVRRAWRAMEAADTSHTQRGEPPRYLGASIQCALCLASVRSLASNIRPGLLRALVENSLWTGAQALATLRENPSLELRADGLAAIASSLPEALLDQAIEMSKGQVSVQLIRRLAECGRGARALDFIRQMPEDGERPVAEALAAAVPLLRQDEIEEALDIASELPAAERLAVIVAASQAEGYRGKQQLLERELGAAICEGSWDAISALAPLLAPEVVWDVAQTALCSVGQSTRLLVLAALLQYLLHDPRRAALAELEANLDRHLEGAEWSVHDRQAVIATLVPHVDAPARERLLNCLVRHRPSETIAAKILPYLEEEHIRALLRTGTGEIEDRLDLWKVLAPAIPDQMWNDLLEVLLAGEIHAGALAKLLPVLPQHAVDRAFSAAEAVDDEAALRAIAPRLTLEQLGEVAIGWSRNWALLTAVAVRYAQLGEWGNARGVMDAIDERFALDRNRSDAALIEVFRAVRGNRDTVAALLQRVDKALDAPAVLGQVAADLPADLLHEALRKAQRVADGSTHNRVRIVLGTALTLAGNARRGVKLAYAGAAPLGKWEKWLTEFDTERIAWALREAADAAIQTESLKILLGPQGFELAGGGSGVVPWDVVQSLLNPADNLPQLEIFLAGLPSAERQAAAVDVIAWKWKGDSRERMVPLAMNIADCRLRAAALLSVLDHAEAKWQDGKSWPLSRRVETVRELLAFAEGAEKDVLVEGSFRCACMLATTDDVPAILAMLSSFREEVQAEALGLNAWQLSDETWREAWRIARAITDPGLRATGLSCLLPRAPWGEASSAFTEALEAAVDAVRDGGDSSAFVAICPSVPEQCWADAWKAVPVVEPMDQRLQSLIALLERAPAAMKLRASKDAVDIAKHSGEATMETWTRIAEAAVEPWNAVAWREAWKSAWSRAYPSWEAAQIARSAPASLAPEFADDVASKFWDARVDRELIRDLCAHLEDPVPFLKNVAAEGRSRGRSPEQWAVQFPRAVVLDWLAIENDMAAVIRIASVIDWTHSDDGLPTAEFIEALGALAGNVADADVRSAIRLILDYAQETQAATSAKAARVEAAYYRSAERRSWRVTDYGGFAKLLHEAGQSTRAVLVEALEPNLSWIQDQGGLASLEQTTDAVERAFLWWP